MSNESTPAAGHVAELISGYIDGELTQQQRQRVERHVEDCADCRRDYEQLAALRERLAGARLSVTGEDTWREHMNDLTVKTTRGIGWLLFIAGALLLGGYAIYEIVTDASVSLTLKLFLGAFYLGLAVLFVSVLRQRLIERRSDKYKDVEI